MRKTYISTLVGLLLIGLLLGMNAYAEEERFALSAKAGTLGVGLEGIARINSRLHGRVAANGFEYDFDRTESDIEYDVEIELLSFSALLDWFPFENTFYLTTGVLANQNEFDLTAKLAGSYKVGDTTYTAAQVGTLTGKMDFNEVAPYVGIGWGNPFEADEDWSFLVDIGVMFQGSPNVDLSVDGTLANNAAFLADLGREEDNLEDEVEELQFYPVVSIGAAYRF